MNKIYAIPLVATLVVLSACSSQTVTSNLQETTSSTQKATSVTSRPQLDNNVASVDIIVRSHWTQANVNDGQIVWIDLGNPRNEYIDPDETNFKKLSVELSIKGSNGSTKDYTIPMFDKMYSNVTYSNITDPQGNGIVILYSELNGFQKAKFAEILATVTLSDSTVVRSIPFEFPLAGGE